MSEPQASSEPLADAADVAPAQPDVAADMAIVLAALGRVEAAVRDGREVLTRLRGCLDEMAQAIVQAKALVDSPAATSLLNEFEHRIDVMIEIAGGEVRRAVAAEQPAGEAAAVSEAQDTADEPTEVPTVSGVVSRLGASGEAPPSAPDTSEGFDSGLVDASNVAKLTAMVQALRDSMPPEEPQPATAPETAAAPEAAAPETTPAAEAAPTAQPVEPATPSEQATNAAPPDQAAATAVPAEREPEPAPASELEPAHDARRFSMAASLPPPEFVSTPAEAMVEPPQYSPPPAHTDPTLGPPPQPAHDPLRALKAMSEHERLALFS